MKLALGGSEDDLSHPRGKAIFIDDDGSWQDAAAVFGIDVACRSLARRGADLVAVIEAWCAGDCDRPAVSSRSRSETDGASVHLPLAAPISPHAKVLVVEGSRNAVSLDRARPIAAMLKYPTAMASPNSTIRLPHADGRFDVDAVLGVVIGRRVDHDNAETIQNCIAGYTLLADVTERHISEREARTGNGLLAKNLPQLSPLGPWIWLPSHKPSPSELHFSLKLGNAVRQEFRLSDLVWSVEEVLAAWSVASLNPGDIVGLGAAIAGRSSPAPGPVPIAADDTVEIVCESIGKLTFRVAAETPANCVD